MKSRMKSYQTGNSGRQDKAFVKERGYIYIGIENPIPIQLNDEEKSGDSLDSIFIFLSKVSAVRQDLLS